MIFTYLIKTLFGSLEVFSMLFASASLLRIPYRSYFKELIAISFIAGIIATINYDILKLPILFNESCALLVYFILLKLLLKLSWGHSFLFVFIGYFLEEMVYVILSAIAQFTGWIAISDMVNSVPITCAAQLIIFCILIPLSNLLYKKGIGFMFISDKLNFKPGIKRATVLMISTVVFCLLSIFMYVFIVMHDYGFEYFSINFGIIGIIAAFWTVYSLSNKELEEHYKM